MRISLLTLLVFGVVLASVLQTTNSKPDKDLVKRDTNVSLNRRFEMRELNGNRKLQRRQRRKLKRKEREMKKLTRDMVRRNEKQYRDQRKLEKLTREAKRI